MLLSARPQDDLNWQIDQTPDHFEFDLGLHLPFFSLEDEVQFNSLAAGLKHFTESVFSLHPVENIILYRGSADFAKYFKWTENQEENFESYRQNLRLKNEEHLKRLFTAEVFVYYFQMLSHRLPDEVSIKLILDATELGTKAQALHLLSPERFEHFTVKHKLQEEGRIGICFPPDDLMTDEVLNTIDHLLQSLPEAKAVYEPLLIEQWDGLDELYIFEDAMSEQCDRKILGFEAAGGKVIKVRGRGI